MVLAIPVVDGHELTEMLLQSLDDSVRGAFEVVIVDNASEKPYQLEQYAGRFSFPVNIIRFDINVGYYAPLKKLYELYDEAEYIGLVHNDMLIYEHGWDVRMAQAFKDDPKLALVGLCGSNEIDSLGGRGGGTVCYFRGAEVKVNGVTLRGQDQAAGRRTTELVPSACLDSLFMMFRRQAIPDLVTEKDQWGHITLAHFYDRIWPVRLIENGWHVATMGVECDHLGGMTTTGNVRYRDDCIKWLESRGFPYDNPETEMYLIAERRYLNEYREEKRLIPMRVNGDYSVVQA